MKALLERANEQGNLNCAGPRDGGPQWAPRSITREWSRRGTFGQAPDPTAQAISVAVPGPNVLLGTKPVGAF